MRHRPSGQKVAIGLIATLVVVFLIGFSMSANNNNTPPQESAVVAIQPTDVVALRDWARRWCRGWNVPDLAAVFGVEATREAIAAYLSEGLTGEARQVVVETCERELA